MSGLRAGAAEWRPSWTAEDATNPTEAQQVNDHHDGHVPQDDVRWQRYPPGPATEDYGDMSEDDENMRWADEQAQLAQDAYYQGQALDAPVADYPPSYYSRPPQMFVPPGATAGRPTHAPPAWSHHGGYDEEAMSMHPESVMTTATSIQVGVAVPKPTSAIRKKNYAKEAAKAARRETIAVKSGLEGFSTALLQSVSPFMAPLRRLTNSSLPHFKLDQRFGKRGQPHTAAAQFIIAPLVNYRPAHFHDLAPGDVMEFHYDLALVLRTITTATCLAINYGPEWKPYAVPFAYLSCSDYAAEVRKLCPEEIPNGKADAIAEGDLCKDVTALILAVPELEILKRKSFAAALKSRSNLYAMYAVFAQLFGAIENYQIQIRDFHSSPSQFIIRTSKHELDKVGGPVVISDSDKLWDLMPNLPVAFTTQPGRVLDPRKAAAEASQAPAAKGQKAVPAVSPAAALAAAATAEVQQQAAGAPATSAPVPAQQAPPTATAGTSDPSGASDVRAAQRQMWLSAGILAITVVATAAILLLPSRKR